MRAWLPAARGRSPFVRLAAAGRPSTKIRHAAGGPVPPRGPRNFYHGLLGLLVVLIGLSGCGYKMSGKADLLPAEIGTIAIPAFDNITTRYRLTQKMATAMTREFTARTRYRIVPNPQNADATLFGAVVNYFSYPIIFDSVTGRASGMQVMVVLNLRLVEEGTGKVLFQASGMNIQSRYEISTDQEAYFEESDVALERISAEVARKAVAAVLEDF